MKQDHFRERALYRAANGAILACIGLFNHFFGIREVTWKNILVLLAVLALFAGVSFLPEKRKGRYLLLAVICLGVPAFVLGLRTNFDFLQAYIKWCIGYGMEQVRWLEGFQLVQTAIVATVSYLLQILLEKFKYLKYVLAFACADGMLFCLLAEKSLTHMGVVVMLFYIAVVYVEWLKEHRTGMRNGSLKKQMLWLSPFFIMYLLLMSIMPAPETPYSWQWAKDIYGQVKESFLKVSQNIFRGGKEDFDTSLSGFSDNSGELGGSVNENDRAVMHLQAKTDLATNMYLIGKVYDTFDGRQWLQEYRDSEMERFIDTMETLYAVRRLDDTYVRDYLKTTTVNIRYEFFTTGYVFAPLKTGNIENSDLSLDYSFEGGDLLFEGRKGYGTEYDVEYYQLNIGEELFDQLLAYHVTISQEEPDQALWKSIAGEYEWKTGRKITWDMVEAHRQMVYENYLNEFTLSKETSTYLSEITKDAETDLERLQAIEKELNSYTYTRTPGALPDKVTNAEEFLDYFLLESRQGYCTYFATAFVLLARAEGFPARYVQGFCVPMENSREATVLSGMAHSWPEVYIDGVGWIPFEPTPGYGRLRYTPWEVSARSNSSIYEEEAEWTEVKPGELQAIPERETENEPAYQETADELGSQQLRRFLSLCIPVILTGFALVLAMDNLLGMYRYGRMGPEERLKAEVQRNLKILSWLGLKREEQETLQELRERGMLMPGFTSLHFIEDYEDVVYGGKKASEEMFAEIRKERESIWNLIRKEKKWSYVLYRMRMFLIRYR